MVEALHYCLGHHSAGADRSVSLAVNAATPYELASLCPFIEDVHPIDHPFVAACDHSADRMSALARHWDYFAALLAPHGGHAGAIWSIDGVHFDYLGAPDR
jgi:hypothetical protein